MGSTGVFTGLRHVLGDRSPNILDPNEWDAFIDRSFLQKNDDLYHVSKHTDRSTYPYETRIKLVGIGYDDENCFSVHNFAIRRNPADVVEFFSKLSEITEPFYLFHSYLDSHWPKIQPFRVQDQIDSTIGPVYKITAEGGEVTLEEFTVEATGLEEVDP